MRPAAAGSACGRKIYPKLIRLRSHERCCQSRGATALPRRLPDAARRCRLGQSLRRRWRSPAGRQAIQPQAARCWGPPSSSACRSIPSPRPRRSIRTSLTMQSLAHLRNAEQARLWPRDRPQWPCRDHPCGGRTGSRHRGSQCHEGRRILAAGAVGIAAASCALMRAADPGQEVRALLAIVAGIRRWPATSAH